MTTSTPCNLMPSCSTHAVEEEDPHRHHAVEEEDPRCHRTMEEEEPRCHHAVEEPRHRGGPALPPHCGGAVPWRRTRAVEEEEPTVVTLHHRRGSGWR
jgi:hypothetical protein